jgi:MSHA pilin protein MshC
MVIIGILAVSALPRFFERNTFDSRGYYDQVISTLRFAQKTAIAQRRFVCVAFAANSITLTTGATPACGTNLTSPAGASPYIVTAPTADVTLSGGTPFNFDALGKASAAQSITVSGYGTAITVEAETGYVH